MYEKTEDEAYLGYALAGASHGLDYLDGNDEFWKQLPPNARGWYGGVEDFNRIRPDFLAKESQFLNDVGMAVTEVAQLVSDIKVVAPDAVAPQEQLLYTMDPSISQRDSWTRPGPLDPISSDPWVSASGRPIPQLRRDLSRMAAVARAERRRFKKARKAIKPGPVRKPPPRAVARRERVVATARRGLWAVGAAILITADQLGFAHNAIDVATASGSHDIGTALLGASVAIPGSG